MTDPYSEAAEAIDKTDRAFRARCRKAVRWGVIGGAGLALAVMGATACSAKYQEPYKDAPTTGKHIREPWTIIEAPDGFSNQATVCLVLPDGTRPGIRLFSAYHGDHPYGAISNQIDATCK